MRRSISLVVILIVMLSSIPAYSEEEYDPQNTMLALNMAIVSVHRIITTQDRIVLQNEYDNIINKLALGNIESDYEMTGLYSELMNFITGKGLRNDEAERFRENYKRREQKQLAEAFSKVEAKGNNLWSVMGNLAFSCVSAYLEYQKSDARAELLEGLNNDLWKLKKEDIEECNRLQVMLLNSSWNLLRQYKLPDEYRLTQESLNGYYKAVNEADPSKRLRMLRARNVERNFQVYPPYWYYRAKAAQESGDDSEALKCWDKFAEVWRPVLRNDPYKLEEAKYRVQKLALNAENNRDELRKWLEVIQDCISAGDWSNNLFAGVAYFLLGDKDEGIACVEENVDFGYEEAVSKTILDEMKKGELNISNLFSPKNEVNEQQTQQTSIKREEPYHLTDDELKNIAEKHNIKYSEWNGRTADIRWKTESSWFDVREHYITLYRSYIYLGRRSSTVFTTDYPPFIELETITYEEIVNNPQLNERYLMEHFFDKFEKKVPLNVIGKAVNALMEIKELLK